MGAALLSRVQTGLGIPISLLWKCDLLWFSECPTRMVVTYSAFRRSLRRD